MGIRLSEVEPAPESGNSLDGDLSMVMIRMGFVVSGDELAVFT